MDELKELFSKHEKEFLKFERIAEPLCARPDLHAFLLLHQLVPGSTDMVCSAEHDQIWLDVDVDKLSKVATESNVIDLIRCGVMYESDTDSLSMFA